MVQRLATIRMQSSLVCGGCSKATTPSTVLETTIALALMEDGEHKRTTTVSHTAEQAVTPAQQMNADAMRLHEHGAPPEALTLQQALQRYFAEEVQNLQACEAHVITLAVRSPWRTTSAPAVVRRVR